MTRPPDNTLPCPICRTPVVFENGLPAKHGRRQGEGMEPCGVGEPGFGFRRQYVKPVKKEERDEI